MSQQGCGNRDAVGNCSGRNSASNTSSVQATSLLSLAHHLGHCLPQVDEESAGRNSGSVATTSDVNDYPVVPLSNNNKEESEIPMRSTTSSSRKGFQEQEGSDDDEEEEEEEDEGEDDEEDYEDDDDEDEDEDEDEDDGEYEDEDEDEEDNDELLENDIDGDDLKRAGQYGKALLELLEKESHRSKILSELLEREQKLNEELIRKQDDISRLRRRATYQQTHLEHLEDQAQELEQNLQTQRQQAIDEKRRRRALEREIEKLRNVVSEKNKQQQQAKEEAEAMVAAAAAAASSSSTSVSLRCGTPISNASLGNVSIDCSPIESAGGQNCNLLQVDTDVLSQASGDSGSQKSTPVFKETTRRKTNSKKKKKKTNSNNTSTSGPSTDNRVILGEKFLQAGAQFDSPNLNLSAKASPEQFPVKMVEEHHSFEKMQNSIEKRKGNENQHQRLEEEQEREQGNPKFILPSPEKSQYDEIRAMYEEERERRQQLQQEVESLIEECELRKQRPGLPQEPNHQIHQTPTTASSSLLTENENGKMALFGKAPNSAPQALVLSSPQTGYNDNKFSVAVDFAVRSLCQELGYQPNRRATISKCQLFTASSGNEPTSFRTLSRSKINAFDSSKLVGIETPPSRLASPPKLATVQETSKFSPSPLTTTRKSIVQPPSAKVSLGAARKVKVTTETTNSFTEYNVQVENDHGGWRMVQTRYRRFKYIYDWILKKFNQGKLASEPLEYPQANYFSTSTFNSRNVKERRIWLELTIIAIVQQNASIVDKLLDFIGKLGTEKATNRDAFGEKKQKKKKV